MKILILGGSNTSHKTGWAAEFAKMSPGLHIENRFLGAVGSLFGLLRLLKMIEEGAARPDVVIFEYALNDSLWLMGGNLALPLIDAALQDVATICAREKIGLLFLCLSLRPPEPEGEAELSRFINGRYESVARARGCAACLTQNDILGGVRQADYVDAMHISPESARAVARAVARRLETPVPWPRGARRALSFRYLDASRAQLEGPGERGRLQSSVFEGPMLTLSRGARCRWATNGALIALLLRSTHSSGWYQIEAGGQVLRKNAQSLARENVPNLVTLHYVTRALPHASEAVVAMPPSESALMALPDDLTLMDGPAHVPFEEQTLEIAGAMIHRPPSRARRVFDAVFAR